MTNDDLFRIAREQSALDLGCRPDDFLQSGPVVVPYAPSPRRRSYYSDPIAATLVSYGHNIVAASSPACLSQVDRYVHAFPWYHCFETPHLHALDDALSPLGQRVCFMAEYWLADLDALRPLPLPAGLQLRSFTHEDFAPYYTPDFANALCAQRSQLDVLGVGAMQDGRLIALAACSADCLDMWQIGIDVLPAFRHQGIASALTSRLALDILRHGKVPFYCCAWSNLPSARNAIRSGFRPAWAEMTAKPSDFVSSQNTSFTAPGSLP